MEHVGTRMLSSAVSGQTQVNDITVCVIKTTVKEKQIVVEITVQGVKNPEVSDKKVK